MKVVLLPTAFVVDKINLATLYFIFPHCVHSLRGAIIHEKNHFSILVGFV
jgi:hypothetical protein